MVKELIALTALGALASTATIAPDMKGHPLESRFKNRNFAHRGLFDNKDVMENSLLAFMKAAKAGYGIELDVQMTADGQVVVFHDESLYRLCGVNKRVSECTWDELKQYKLGYTMQTIPLFSSVLDTIEGQVPIIVEIKTTEAVDYTCLRVYDLLRYYIGDYCIESMNPLIVGWFKTNAPQVMRGQLGMRYADTGTFGKAQSAILSNMMFNFISRPHFIAYEHHYSDNKSLKLCRSMGAFTIGWTVHEDEYDKAKREFDSIIFEGFEPPKKIHE